MNAIDKLAELLKELPGVGPRQAKRFVYFLLMKNENYLRELSDLIPEIKKRVSSCQNCFRYFSKDESNGSLCKTCLDKNRSTKSLMIVSRDTDYEAVEKSNSFDGYYFVLGGILPVLEQDPQKFIRLNELRKVIEERKIAGLEEIILALNANPDGDFTADFLKKELSNTGLKITTLGRGLSTGTELEYSDKDTIGNALKNRN
ncbi:recombination protein RecR [Candidatus Nomurabacteria bacterium]|nr:recombination protein RecR [Candidatus Nomurabacteria bacterium]